MKDFSTSVEEDFPHGTRVGRYLVLRDVDGRKHALTVTAVYAVCEEEDGDTMLFLPAGRMLRVNVPFAMLLGWLDGRG